MIVGVHGLPDDNGRLKEYVPGFDAETFEAHERFFVDDVWRCAASRFGVALPQSSLDEPVVTAESQETVDRDHEGSWFYARR